MSSLATTASVGIGPAAAHRPWALAATVLLLLLAAWAVRPTLRVDISPNRIQPFADQPHTAPVPAPGFAYVVPGDSPSRPRNSTLALYEDGARLGPAHAQHRRIRDAGRGAYSHTGRMLIFSASDNTDPRTNGRRYTVEARTELSPWVLWPGLLLAAAAGAVGLRRWWRLPARSAVWRACSRAWAWLDRTPARTAPRRWLASPAAGLCLGAAAFIAAVSYFASSERSAWILMTAPDAVLAGGNSLLAWSAVVHGSLIHAENIPFMGHALMFSGGPITIDFYALRPLYGYFVSALVPLLDWFPALLATNLIGWAAGVALVHAFALKATGERAAAFWASLFSIGGMGFVLHVHDYSAHLLAFTFYFAAVYLVYVSEVWHAPQPWAVHAGLGCVLALAALEYHTGLVALLGYALASARHNRLIRIAAVCAFVYGCTALWPQMLNWLGGMKVDYGAFERIFLKTAIELWVQLLADPLLLLRTYGTVILRFMSYEMPLLLAFGAAGLAALVAARRDPDFAIFVAAFFVVPILALAAYVGPDIVSRGYISYQTSIFVYVGAGWLLHRLARPGPRGPAAAGLVGLGLLAGTLAWNLAYLAGALGPSKIYFVGIDLYWTGLTSTLSQLARVPEVLSLTGAEPTPRLFFGSATLSDAGLMPCATDVMSLAPPERHWLRALMVRAPFALLTAGAALLLLHAGLLRVAGKRLRATKPACWLTGGLAVLVGASALMTYPTRAREFPSFCSHGLGGAAGRHLRYEIDVSPQFLARLDALPADVEDVEILHGFRATPIDDASVRVALVGDGLRVDFAASDYVPQVNRALLIAALHRTPRLALEVTRDAAAPFAASGWQRNGLPGRRLIVDGRSMGGAEQPVLPTFEIRARQPGGLFLPDLVGF